MHKYQFPMIKKTLKKLGKVSFREIYFPNVNKCHHAFICKILKELCIDKCKHGHEVHNRNKNSMKLVSLNFLIFVLINNSWWAHLNKSIQHYWIIAGHTPYVSLLLLLLTILMHVLMPFPTFWKGSMNLHILECF